VDTTWACPHAGVVDSNAATTPAMRTHHREGRTTTPV